MVWVSRYLELSLSDLLIGVPVLVESNAEKREEKKTHHALQGIENLR